MGEQDEKKTSEEMFNLDDMDSFFANLSKEINEIKEVQSQLQNQPDVPEAVENNHKKLTEMTARISEDKMEGWLYLPKPEEGSRYSKEEILTFLANNNIKSGYIMSNIVAMIKKGVYERFIKVAVAESPVDGKDGYYAYYFDYEMLDKKKEPTIKADGTVDYSELSFMINVEKDKLLMKYYPKILGEDGAYVTGEPIKATPGKDLSKYKCKGINYNPETEEYYANLDGQLVLRAPFEMEICNVYQITGDVTQLNGRIDFYGDIDIIGNIESGTVIRSAKSVTIAGSVEACEIYAGGDIILKKGIQGANRAKIVCGGDVYANFIEHTNIIARGDINSNIILNSEIHTDGKIILTGKSGSLIGGTAHARKGIETTNLGNDVELKTIVHVGLENKDYLKNQDVMKVVEEIKAGLAEVMEKMTEIMAQRNIRPLTKEDVVKLSKLNEKKNELMTKLKENQVEEEKINQLILEAKNAKIRVNGHIYRGVVMGIDSQRLVLEHSTSFMEYTNQRGIIEGSVIAV